jgi:hypothetical protein
LQSSIVQLHYWDASIWSLTKNEYFKIINLGLYCSESLVAIVLALNRCIEMWDHRIAENLFEKHKVYYWMGICLIYGILLGLFTIPPVPNGILVGWFFNPHLPYFLEDKEGVVNLNLIQFKIFLSTEIYFSPPIIFTLDLDYPSFMPFSIC